MLVPPINHHLGPQDDGSPLHSAIILSTSTGSVHKSVTVSFVSTDVQLNKGDGVCVCVSALHMGYSSDGRSSASISFL